MPAQSQSVSPQPASFGEGRYELTEVAFCLPEANANELAPLNDWTIFALLVPAADLSWSFHQPHQRARDPIHAPPELAIDCAEVSERMGNLETRARLTK
jgi:hypothetical protein